MKNFQSIIRTPSKGATLSLIAAVYALINIYILWDKGKLPEFIGDIFAVIQIILYWIFWPLEKLLFYLFDIRLPDGWREASLIMNLYFAIHIKHGIMLRDERPNIQRRKRVSAFTLRIIAAIVATISTWYLLYIYPDYFFNRKSWLIFCIIAGNSIFQFVFALQFGMDRWRFDSKSFAEEFFLKIRGGIEIFSVGVMALSLGVHQEMPEFLLLMIVITFFGSYHIWLVFSDKESVGRHVNMTQRMERGNFIIGVSILRVVLYIILILFGLDFLPSVLRNATRLLS